MNAMDRQVPGGISAGLVRSVLDTHVRARRLFILALTLAAALVWLWASSQFVEAATPAQIKVTWTAGPGGVEDGFMVLRKTGLLGTYAAIGTVGKGVLTFTDTGPLAPGQMFCYQVSAFNAAGSSAPSAEACVILVSIPGTPGNATVTIIPAVP